MEWLEISWDDNLCPGDKVELVYLYNMVTLEGRHYLELYPIEVPPVCKLCPSQAPPPNSPGFSKLRAGNPVNKVTSKSRRKNGLAPEKYCNNVHRDSTFVSLIANYYLWSLPMLLLLWISLYILDNSGQEKLCVPLWKEVEAVHLCCSFKPNTKWDETLPLHQIFARRLKGGNGTCLLFCIWLWNSSKPSARWDEIQVKGTSCELARKFKLQDTVVSML